MVKPILHYIWLGKEKPDLAKKCIASFHDYFPMFEIREWGEDNIDISGYDPILKAFYEESYRRGKYAFCSDIARLYILQEHGGIYADTDYEFIKPLPAKYLETPFLARNNPVSTIGNGIWGCGKDDQLVSASIRWFSEAIRQRGPAYGKLWIFNRILTVFLTTFGYDRDNPEVQKVAGYLIGSSEELCPMDRLTRKISITDTTIAIHHYHNSWIRE